MPKADFLAPFIETLRDLNAWFADSGVAGVVIGGAAVSILGRPRLTADVDAVILAGEADVERLLGSGSKFGFVPRLSNAVDFARKRRILLLRHAPDSTNVDVSLGALPFEKEMIARRKTADVAGVPVALPSPEDLIIMKAIAHRPIDLHDIDGILDAHPGVDVRRIRKWVGDFSAALEMPEILADVHAILTRHRRRPAKKRARK